MISNYHVLMANFLRITGRKTFVERTARNQNDHKSKPGAMRDGWFCVGLLTSNDAGDDHLFISLPGEATSDKECIPQSTK